MVFRWVVDPELRAAVQQPVRRGRLGDLEQLDADGRRLRARRRRRHRSWCRATRSTDPHRAVSGQGLPASAATSGYALLDEPGISTSRVPGADRLQAGDGGRARHAPSRRSTASNTAVVHLALPEKQVFADEQDPPTASVLVDTAPGNDARTRAGPGRRQPGRLQHRRPRPRQGHRRRRHRQGALRPATAPAALGASTRDQQVADFQDQLQPADPVDARPRRRPGQLDRPGHRRPRLRQGRHRDDDATTRQGRSGRSRRRRSTETYNGAGGAPAARPASSAPTARWTHRHRRRRRRLGVREAVDTQRQRGRQGPSSTARPRRAASSRCTSASCSTPTRRADDRRRPTIEDLIAAARRHRPERGDTVEVTSCRSTPRPRRPPPPSSTRPRGPRPTRSADDADPQRRHRRSAVLLIVLLAWLKRAGGGPRRASEAHDVRRRAAAPGRRSTAPPPQAALEPAAARRWRSRRAERDADDEHARRARRPGRAPARRGRRAAPRLAGGASPDERHDLAAMGVRKAAILLIQLGRSAPRRCSATSPRPRSRRSPPRSPGSTSIERRRDRSRCSSEFTRHGDRPRAHRRRAGSASPAAARAVARRRPRRRDHGAAQRRRRPDAVPVPAPRRPGQLRSFIADEHPQIIALVLAHMTPDKASLRAVRARRPTCRPRSRTGSPSMDRTSPEIIRAVEAALERKLSSVLQPSEMSRVGGVDPLVNIINRSDRATERQILEGLEALDAELAEEVRSRMFVFEDIVTLDDRSVQLVLRQVDEPAARPRAQGRQRRGPRQDHPQPLRARRREPDRGDRAARRGPARAGRGGPAGGRPHHPPARGAGPDHGPPRERR